MRRALSVLAVLLVVAAPATGTVAAAPDASGEQLPERWNEAVGGDGDDKLTTALKVDGGYLVVGWSNSSSEDGKHDGFVAKVDRSGRTVWERSYGGPGTDRLFDAKRVEDGYLLAGLETDETGGVWDGWVLKVNESGGVQWQRSHGGAGPDAFWSLARSGDSTYVGGWQRDGTTKAWVMELNDDGSRNWSERYDTLRSGSNEYVNSIFVTDDGHLLLTGTIEGSSADPSDAWVLKVDGNDGEVEWDETYGGSGLDRIHDAVASSDGGYVLAGRTASEGDGQQDGWTLKISEDGTERWSRTFGTPKDDAFYGVMDDGDGYVFSGAKHKMSENGADGWMLKMRDDGQRAWSETYGRSYWDKFWPVVGGHGGGYLAVGESTSFGENRDGWLVRVGGPTVSAIRDADANASGTTVVLDGSPVRSVTFAGSNVSGVLAVDEPANLSALSPPGRPLYAVTMTGPESASNDSITVEFEVGDGGNRSDLRIAQRTADGWTVLNTTVDAEGNGTATLTATANGTGTLAVTAVDAPTASIGSVDVVTVGESVTLSANDSTAENATLAGYEWTVAGETESGATAEVAFDSPGNHTVRLAVTDDDGLRDTATETVLVNDRPEVSVEVPDSTAVGEAATFSADVTDEVGDVTVTWRFADGEVSGESVERSFGTPGTKTVTVVVEDEYGATVTKEISVEVESRSQNTDSNEGRTDESTTDTTTAEPSNENGTPGFGVATALVALLAAALLARRVS